MVSGLRPLAVGYASSPVRVGIGTWTRWRDAIEVHAADVGMPLLSIVTDDHTTSGAGLAGLIRKLGEGQVSVIVVPGIEHLSSARDGTEYLVRHLLDIHFGVQVRPVSAQDALLGRTEEQVISGAFEGSVRVEAAARGLRPGQAL